jgi:hypothetical protein
VEDIRLVGDAGCPGAAGRLESAAAAALGALAYTAVNSAGYYAEAGKWPPVVLFGGLLGAVVWAAAALVRRTRGRAQTGRHRAEGSEPDPSEFMPLV